MSDVLRKILATKVKEVAVGMAGTGRDKIAAMAADMPPTRAFAHRIRECRST